MMRCVLRCQLIYLSPVSTARFCWKSDVVSWVISQRQQPRWSYQESFWCPKPTRYCRLMRVCLSTCLSVCIYMSVFLCAPRCLCVHVCQSVWPLNGYSLNGSSRGNVYVSNMGRVSSIKPDVWKISQTGFVLLFEFLNTFLKTHEFLKCQYSLKTPWIVEKSGNYITSTYVAEMS